MNRSTSSPLASSRNDFRLLAVGRFASQVGDQLQSLALPLTVIVVTGSTTQAGLVLGLQTVAALILGLPAGALADRWDRKRLMIMAESARAVLVASIPVAILTGGLTPAHLYVVAAFNGAFGTFFNAANSSALPSLVSPRSLPRVLAFFSTAGNALRIVGAPVAGIAYAVGHAVPFVANAVSFAVSAATIRAIRTPFNTARERSAASRRAIHLEVGGGLQWLLQHRVLRTLALLDAADGFRFGAGYLLIITLAQQRGATAFAIGLVFAGAGIGGLLGSVLAARLAARAALGRLSVTMLWLEAAAFPFYALVPSWWLLPAVAFTESVIAPIYTVALDSHRLTITPDHLRGRITGTLDTVASSTAALGTISSGALIASIGPAALTYALTGLLIALAVTASRNPDIRRATA